MDETIDTLVKKLYDAKRSEDAAKAERVQIEEAIAAQVETAPNGSKTVQCDCGLKVTVKRALSYKADVDAIRSLDLPDDKLPVKLVPASYEFDDKLYEALHNLGDPLVMQKLNGLVTVTPRKVSVTLKL